VASKHLHLQSKKNEASHSTYKIGHNANRRRRSAMLMAMDRILKAAATCLETLDDKYQKLNADDADGGEEEA
jgi:hypothetical protein